MDWPLHPGAVPRPAAKRHGNAGMVNNKTRDKIREARERQDDGALVPDSRLLSSPVWQPLPGTTPVSLEHRTGCAWPVTRASPHLFCNEPKVRGSYCQHHHSIYRSKNTP
jgi:hypothetical protein